MDRRRDRIVETGLVGLLVAAMSVFILWKMDYLGGEKIQQIRMTDNSRSAYVAKNIVDGRGYTTSEMPAFLVDFYDQHGTLHDDSWPNADRFPFTAYAISALYLITGQTSYVFGILVYNLLCFFGLMFLVHRFARQIWNDRWAALAAVSLALLHPRTFVLFVYKDADLLLLTTGVMLALYGYIREPESLSWKRATLLGTLLAWTFLARPNVGGIFVALVGWTFLRRAWLAERGAGINAVVRAFGRWEALVLGVFFLWCLPFMIHSLGEWGSPFFSVNSLYQAPLGTRFVMNTDPWWKYSEPGNLVTLGRLLEEAPGQLASKFTSSWLMTIKNMVRTFALEMMLGLGLLAVLARRARGQVAADETPEAKETRERTGALLWLAKFIGIAFVVNFGVLPLFGYQSSAFRDYLTFVMPLLWIAAGWAVVLLVQMVRPVVTDALARVRTSPGPLVAISVLALIVWNFGSKAEETNPLFGRTAEFVGKHWLGTLFVLVLLLWHRWIIRAPAFPRVVIAIAAVSAILFRPDRAVKRAHQIWFAADPAVWKNLRERPGLVSSFALQGEVNWETGRRNIPAPDLLMHLYSFKVDHKLDVEDVYIESAAALVGTDGPFNAAAPGFEAYDRMQAQQGRLPGYTIVFNKTTKRADPKFRIKARAKASTVYRLTDPDQIREITKSPTRIELGLPENIVHSAYGWADYLTLEGKPAIAATNRARERYVEKDERPWQDSAITFFLDERRPTTVELEIYATQLTTLDFYWNLDLFYYDRPADRKAHAIGSYQVTKPGWQKVPLTIPAGLTRAGLNQLGFRAASFQPVSVCLPASSEFDCRELIQQIWPRPQALNDTPIVIRDPGIARGLGIYASAFVGTLDFRY